MHFTHLNLAGLLSALCAYELQWLSARYGFPESELKRIRDVVHGPVPVKRGDVICRQGEVGEAIYAVASGSFKASAADANGRELVGDLYFEEDFLGLESLGRRPFQFTIEALEPGSVFRLAVADLTAAQVDVPGLERELLALVSREVWRRSEHRLLLGERDAASRLAAFLEYLSRRERDRGRDPATFRLQMRRQDIAAFLGLATETVSRLFKRFARREVLEVKSRRVRLRDPGSIARLAGRKYLPVLLAALAALELAP